MRFNRVLFIFVLLVFVAASGLPAAGQGCACCKHMKNGQGPGPGMPKYNPDTEASLKGTVEAVDAHESPMGWKGIHLKLKADAGRIDVHVGPAWFIEEQGFAFAKGDALEVLGSRQMIEGKDSLLAREIRKGEKVLVLRGAGGIPKWSGGRRNPKK